MEEKYLCSHCGAELTPEEMTEFLKNEYKTTGKGFEFDGNLVPLWFDEMGMRIGYGTSAKENTLAVMGWSEVESHIRVMVENGTYMSANEVFLVDAVERERIATDINNFFRDGISEMPENLELKFSDYPASMERLCELLSTTEGRELIKNELEKAKEQLDSGEKQIKWRYVKRPDYLLEQLADLGVEKKEFPAPDTRLITGWQEEAALNMESFVSMSISWKGMTRKTTLLL